MQALLRLSLEGLDCNLATNLFAAKMQTVITRTDLSKESLGQSHLCDKDELRTSFSLAMSAMYKHEVPLYGDLVRIVREVNQAVAQDDELMVTERLDLERHGAIRLGTPAELRTVRRIFGLIGLFPVGYYDLSEAGLPMHATAFRPIQQEALAKNPFRVFTTLLRPELLSPAARDLAMSHILQRNIFSDELMTLIEIGEDQKGFLPEQGERFIIEAMRTFHWQATAASTIEDYNRLKDEHPILADIACFNTAHINHLTPRTLDIEESEKKMKEAGLSVKSKIEGPPARRNPILLRQTSFLALQEPILFRTKDSSELVNGHHRARFGEIEQRGAAVTREGRKLYDTILNRAMQRTNEQPPTASSDAISQIISEEFEQYPDEKDALIQHRLIFCDFRTTSKAGTGKTSRTAATAPLSELLAQGVIKANPITYEDFLPLSAAGIFMSNLQSQSQPTEKSFESFGDQESLETSLGCSIMDPNDLYRAAQRESLGHCARELGLVDIVSDNQTAHLIDS